MDVPSDPYAAPAAAGTAGEGAGIPLRRLLLAVGDPLVDVLAAPAGLDVRVDNVVIVDPEDEAEAFAGDLVLLIGARGSAARHLVRAAARRGAAAVAVKVHSDEPAYPPPQGWGTAPQVRRGGEEVALLRAEASDAGVALLGVRPEVRWDQLQSLCRSVLDDARLTSEADLGETAGDLYSLAQTISALTGGLVTIEDAASRVLAHSSGEEADELRRLSVLGRRGPEQYLALLREWGVFSRLRAGEEVVRIDEHPQLGIRRRLAVGIHAGSQPLGTIWVQEGAHSLAEDAEQALLGAARMTALHLVRHRTEATVGLRLRDDLLASLLEGRIEAAALADTIEVNTDRPALVVAFAISPSGAPGAGGRAEPARGGGTDRSGRELNRRRLVDLITVHTAAYRRTSLVTAVGGRIYVLMPDLARGGGSSGSGNADSAADSSRRSAESSVLALTRKTVEAARATLGVAVQGAVGSAVNSLGAIPDSRAEADRILDAMGRDLAMDVATMSDVRTRVLISETLAYLRGTPALRDPRVSALADHDAAQGSDLVVSLLAYLEEFGDVRTAAARLHIHPNTLRYRVRRAESVSGIDLSDPTQRLFTHLQLLMERAT
ncbi:PucR family transcriptional regulator [Streptomonospora wellingtoniae]|uniref:Helix-turn-helix domain-containing protein n=1 Tax=Streptomonospora wellingtoniae TaxID=3075544 RepID=A0ABU2KSR1_9ACTN|nr:helix-turn-helix domain-containing protein [Streptomonospora sp. DSM 45055]MDT0302246.1 helix-turn-helix domain-containing protein [Streptomonospora sp. DSM 45055]